MTKKYKNLNYNVRVWDDGDNSGIEYINKNNDIVSLQEVTDGDLLIEATGSITLKSGDNKDLVLDAGSTGQVVLDGFRFPDTDDSNYGQVLFSDGQGQLFFGSLQDVGALSVYLNGLKDVELNNLEDKQLLQYDEPSDKWINVYATETTTVPWGNITGTLSDQTDLQAELDNKQPLGNYLTDVQQDTTPTLGGNLSLNQFGLDVGNSLLNNFNVSDSINGVNVFDVSWDADKNSFLFKNNSNVSLSFDSGKSTNQEPISTEFVHRAWADNTYYVNGDQLSLKANNALSWVDAGFHITPNIIDGNDQPLLTTQGQTKLAISIDNGVSTELYYPLTDGAPNQVLTTDGNKNLYWSTPSGGPGDGVSSFIELTDTPSNFTGQQGKLLAVNATENALEYIDQSIFNGDLQGNKLTDSTVAVDNLDLFFAGDGIHLDGQAIGNNINNITFDNINNTQPIGLLWKDDQNELLASIRKNFSNLTLANGSINLSLGDNTLDSNANNITFNGADLSVGAGTIDAQTFKGFDTIIPSTTSINIQPDNPQDIFFVLTSDTTNPINALNFGINTAGSATIENWGNSLEIKSASFSGVKSLTLDGIKWPTEGGVDGQILSLSNGNELTFQDIDGGSYEGEDYIPGLPDAPISPEDLVFINIKKTTAHTFSQIEEGVQLDAIPDQIQRIEIVDTVFGPQTGVRLVDGALALNSYISGYMLESGSSTRCLVSFKTTTFANKDDIESYVDTDLFVFRSSSSNEGTVSFAPKADVVPIDSIFVLTTQLEDMSEVSFESEVFLGRNIPALHIELTGIKRPN